MGNGELGKNGYNLLRTTPLPIPHSLFLQQISITYTGSTTGNTREHGAERGKGSMEEWFGISSDQVHPPCSRVFP